MLRPLVAHFLKAAMPDTHQAHEMKRSMASDSFQNIFRSIQETSQHMDQRDKRPMAVAEKREEPADTVPAENENLQRREQETVNDRETAPQPEANEAREPAENRSARQPEETKQPADSSQKENNIQERINSVLKKVTPASSAAPQGVQEKIEKLASFQGRNLDTLSKADLAQIESLLDSLSKFSIKESGGDKGLAGSQNAQMANMNIKSEESAQRAPGKTGVKAEARRIKAVKADSAGLASDKETTGKSGDAGQQNITASKDNKKSVKTRAVEVKLHKSEGTEVKLDKAQNSVNGAGESSRVAGPATKASGQGGNLTGASAISNNSQSRTMSNAPDQSKSKAASREQFDRMLIDQIVKKTKINVRPNGVSSMQIQLDPPNLGKVKMKVNVHDNIVKAILVAETKEVRGAIESNIDHLKNSLHNQGLKVDQIIVTTSEGGFSARNEELAQSFGQGKNKKDGGSHGLGDQEDQILESAVKDEQARARAHDGTLNVVA